MANNIQFGVGFKVDNSSLEGITKQLKEIRQLSSKDLININNTTLRGAELRLNNINLTAKKVESSLGVAFDPKINSTNLKTFNNELEKNNLTIAKIQKSFHKAGAQGDSAFRSLLTSVTTVNKNLNKTETILDKVGKTLINTIRWNLSSSIINKFSSSIQEAYGYVKHLDSALNDIRIVTQKSTDEMDKFAQKANTAAQSLGKSTNDYVEASLLYYQQGLGNDEVAARTETTLKAANVTGQSASEVSEQLTSVWNGFQVTAENTEKSVDILAAVAATTASDLEELSTAMSKVASAANAMGVSQEQLTAMLSTVISVTREAPETVGQAFKTIFARVSDIEQGLDDEFASLGNYSGKLAAYGVNVLDINGNLRDMGDVLEEIGEKWSDLTREQQISIAQTMAGQRQYSKLIALFDNWDQYGKAMNTAENAIGTLQKQQDIYMESTAAHLEKMNAALENVYDSFLDTNTINNFADAITNVANVFAGFLDSIGGGEALLMHLGAIGLNVFNKQIGDSLTNILVKAKKIKEAQSIEGLDLLNLNLQDPKIKLDEITKGVIDLNTQLKQHENLFSEDDLKFAKEQTANIIELTNKHEQYIEAVKRANVLLDENDKIDIGKDRAETLAESLEKVNEKIEEQIETFTKYEDDINNLVSTVSMAEDKQERINNFEEQTKQIEDFAKKVIAANTKIGNTRLAENIQKDLEKFQNQVKNLDITSDEYKKALEDFGYSLINQAKTSSLAADRFIETNKKIIKNSQDAVNTMSLSAEDLKALIDELNNKITEPIAISNFIQSINGIVAGFGQISSSVISVNSIIKIWKDETSSAGEKIVKTFSNLSITIPQVINGFFTLKSSYEALKSSTFLLKKAQELLTEEQLRNSVVTTTNGTVQLTFSGILNIVKMSVEKVTASLQTFTASLWALLAPFTPILIAVGALTAALAVGFWIDDAPRRELEKLKEEAENASEAFDKVKLSIDDTDNKLTTIKNQTDTLEDLEKGTREWNKAVRDINSSIDELIEKFPELEKMGAILTDDNGIKNISEEGLEYINQKENEKYLVSNFNKIQTSLNISLNELSQNYDSLLKILQLFAGQGSGTEKLLHDILNLRQEGEISKTDILNLLEQNKEDYDFYLEDEYIDEFVNELLEYVEANKELLDLTQGAAEQVIGAEKEILNKVAQTLNSNRTVNELKFLNEDFDYTNITEKANQKVEEDFGTWNNHINYKETDEEWEKIQEFLALQGDNVEYVKQAWGKLVAKIDGEEKRFSKEDVMRQLANLEFSKIAEEEIKQGIINSLNNELDNIDFAELDVELLTSIDNFKKGLEQSLKNTDINPSKLIQPLIDSANGDKEQLKESFNLLNNLNFNDSDIQLKLKQLSENFDNTTEGVNKFIDSLKELSTESFIKNADFENIAKEINFSTGDADYLKELAENIFKDAQRGANGFNKEIAKSPELLKETVKEVARLQRGYKNLYNNMDKWLEAMNEGGKESIDAIIEIKEALADILNLDVSDIDSDFVVDNIDLIKQAANGSEEAVKQLQLSLFELSMQEIITTLGIDREGFDLELMGIAQDILNFELDPANNIDIGASINDEPFIDALNNLIQESGMTRDQVNEMLSTIGYTPQYVEKPVDQDIEVSSASISQEVTPTETIKWGENGEKTYSGYNVRTKIEPVVEHVKGYTELMAFNGEGQPAPEIKGLTKTGGGIGSSKLPSYVPSASKPSSSGGGGGKGGGGGGGGGGTAKEPAQKDLIEETADRYHDIDIELQNITRDLDRLDKVQSKLTGKDLIDNLNKQLDILNKQVDAYQRKVDIAKVELAENRIALSQMGVTFDTDGQISNYTEAYQAALKKYNDAITAYNLMSAEEQESTGEAAIELAQKEYEKFKEKLERYDELINNVIPDLEDSIQDAIDKQIELNIEKFKMEIEVRLDMADAERSWNEFKRKVIDGIADDNYLGVIKSQYADLLSYFNTAGTGKGPIQALTEQLNGTLDQLKSMDGTLGNWASSYGDNQAAALEDLQTYLDELMDQMMDVEDLVKDIEDTYLDMIDSIKDAFEEQLDNYELIDDIIEHNKNVIELLYGDKAYDQMAQYYDKQEQNNLQQLDFLRQEADFWKQKMDAEEQGSEAWKQYKENWQDALGNLNDQVENSIETLIDKYTNLIDNIFDKLNNKISGGLGLDYISTEWDLINKNADEYLDTINRAFETQKLQEKFNEALANNTGLKAQQQIKNLMDQQLGDLEQREKLTQYDVERAEKLLEIELKKIALQDAQQNKSKMRLRRDAQGNYTYQFISDEQKIADAQKELAEAQNSLYNFDKDRYQQNLNEIYDTYNEFQEKLKELYANTALSDEERERQKTLLIQQYGELINAKTEQNAQIRLNLEQSAFNELAKMYNTNIDEFNAMTEEQRNALMEGLIPYWNSGIQEMVNTFAGEGGFIPVCSESFKDLEEATKDYVDSLNEIEAAAGVNFDSIAQGYDKNIELAQELIVKNDELISQYERELSAVQDVLSAVRDLATEYAAVKKNAIEASEAAMKYAQEEAKRKAEAAEEERKKLEAANKPTNNTTSNTTTTKPSTSGTTGSSSNKKINSISDIKIGDKLKFVSGRYYYTSYGAQPSGDYNLGREVSVVYMNPGAPYPIALHGTGNTPWDLGWVKLDQLEKLKTGGYTGAFGNEGRLGVLHEKELVLNANDTENILSAVSVLRGLSDILGAKTLMNLSNAIDKIQVNSNVNNNNEELFEQNVHITATFPNVKNSNEVEDAINNLINTAAQRRNRRGR